MAGNTIGGKKAAAKNLANNQTSTQKSDERAALLLLHLTEVVKDLHKILNVIAT